MSSVSEGQTFECATCGASVTVGVHERTARCLYCASPQVVARPPTPNRPTPMFAVGFVVTPERALGIARAWVKRPLFAPSAFRRAHVEEIRGLYVPAYLYSAAVHSTYEAEIGENYQTTETYTTRDSQGRTVTRTRTKTHTEWRHLAGAHASYVADRVVTASRGIPNAELEAIEPFDLRALSRYSPKLVSGWVSEEPTMTPAECVALARAEAVSEVGRRLDGFMPGDHHRNLRHQSQVADEDLTLALVPVWVLPVRYAEDEPVVRLLVNGQTGLLHGKPPLSWVKVALAVFLGLALVALPILIAVIAGALR